MKDKLINGALYWLGTWLVILVIALSVYTAGGSAQLTTRLCIILLVALGLWAHGEGIKSWHADIKNFWALQGKERLGTILAWTLWVFLTPGIIFATWYILPMISTAAVVLISPWLQVSLFNTASLALLSLFYILAWAGATWKINNNYLLKVKIWKWSILHFWLFNLLGMFYFFLRMKIPFLHD